MLWRVSSRVCFVCGLVLVWALTGMVETTCAVDRVPVKIAVQADQPGAAPMQVGIFFEDINYGADGGLYPERVKNRSFEFTEPLMGWTVLTDGGAQGTATVISQQPLNSDNPHFVRLTAQGQGGYGLSNEGFFGIGVQEGAEFTFSVYARSADATPPALHVQVKTAAGRAIGSQTLAGFTRQWKQHACTLTVDETDPHARLEIRLSGAGTVDLDMISLFPRDTWNGHPNGLRPDLVKLLADLKPSFLRFPGGCIVEGRTLAVRYQWKTTIGDLASRRLIINRWNDEFKHRPAPDYFQSFGLGFYEYFLLCEDLGARPLPILNCGMACQFNSGELAPLEQLDPYIQDALDLIEFARGPATSDWGRRRADMGHVEPFPLTMLGIGNEQWGPAYIERYERFARVLKDRHPDVKLVSSSGPQPADDKFFFAWPKLRELNADIVDEHCYAPPAWFFDNAQRYDPYDRQGPKVFMGEYAAQSVRTVSPDNRSNWECALAEAAFLTGLDRNGDVVTMSAYAPLSGHVDGWQWRPNLIWFDNLRSFATPSYYVQQLFSCHSGTAILPIQVTGQSPPNAAQPGVFASASLDKATGEVIVKAVNSAAEPRDVIIQLDGVSETDENGTAIVLAGRALADENSLEEPTKIAPVTTSLPHVAKQFDYTLQPWSMSVLRIKLK